MLKNLCELSHQVENKMCRFVCDNDTPIHYIKEALFQFQKYVGAIEDAAKAQQEANKPVVDPEPVAPEGNEHV
jgi:hypothetical protein